MNRQQRRQMGISKETSDKLENLNKPCTILEAVQLAQGVADDKISEYHNNINSILVSLSIQIEVLKELLFKDDKDIENEFIERFNSRVNDYNKEKEKAINEMKKSATLNRGIPKTDVTPGDTEITVTK